MQPKRKKNTVEGSWTWAVYRFLAQKGGLQGDGSPAVRRTTRQELNPVWKRASFSLSPELGSYTPSEEFTVGSLENQA